jgi:hypothetical protein
LGHGGNFGLLPYIAGKIKGHHDWKKYFLNAPRSPGLNSAMGLWVLWRIKGPKIIDICRVNHILKPKGTAKFTSPIDARPGLTKTTIRNLKAIVKNVL